MKNDSTFKFRSREVGRSRNSLPSKSFKQEKYCSREQTSGFPENEMYSVCIALITKAYFIVAVIVRYF